MKTSLFWLCLLLNVAAHAELIHGRTDAGNMAAIRVETAGGVVVEERFSYCADKAADAACKSSAGFVHNISCAGTDAAATAGDVALRDATSAGTGTIVKQIAFAAAFQQPFTLTIDSEFATGIYLDFTTTADVACAVSYR